MKFQHQLRPPVVHNRLKPSKLIHKTPLLIVIQQAQEILKDSHWLVPPKKRLHHASSV